MTERWRAAPSGGTLTGLLALLVVGGLLAGLVFRGLPSAESLAARSVVWGLLALFGLLALALMTLLWGLLSLAYTLESDDGGALVIRWAWRTVRIPLAEIEYFGLARQVVQPAGKVHTWPWPGYFLNGVQDPSLGRIQLVATLPLRRQLLVCSSLGSFGISPERSAALMERYYLLRAATSPVRSPFATPPERAFAAELSTPVADSEEAPVEGLAAAVAAPGLLRDRVTVSLLLLGGALVAAMLWFILLRYDSVPRALPLHYSATGQPDRIGTPREIFILPLITALAAVANVALGWSVVRFDRFAARLLVGGTCLVQLVAWVALLKLF